MYYNYIQNYACKLHNTYYDAYMYAIQLYRCTYMKSVRYQIEQWQGLQGSVWITCILTTYVTVIHWHLKTHSPQFL